MMARCEPLITIEAKALDSLPLHFLLCQPPDGFIGRFLMLLYWSGCLGLDLIFPSSILDHLSCVPSYWCLLVIGV